MRIPGAGARAKPRVQGAQRVHPDAAVRADGRGAGPAQSTGRRDS